MEYILWLVKLTTKKEDDDDDEEEGGEGLEGKERENKGQPRLSCALEE